MVIVITLPDFIEGETERIVRLLAHEGVDLVHIRKPGSDINEMERFLRNIPTVYHNRLVLHDHHLLAMKYSLYGINLNSRNPHCPAEWRGCVSRSCHSIEEVVEWKDKCDYLSLSPIFDSISKQGYHSAFTPEMISQARQAGIIDSKVLALGGVTFNKIDEVMEMGFGGAMILGDAWK